MSYRRHLLEQGGYPQWMIDANKKYNIPLTNLLKAYSEWNNVQYAFHANSDNQWGYLITDGSAYINTKVIAKKPFHTIIRFKVAAVESTSVCGAIFVAYYNNRFFAPHINQGGWCIGSGYSTLTTGTVSVNTQYLVECSYTASGNTFKIGDEIVASGNAVTDTTLEAYLFCRNQYQIKHIPEGLVKGTNISFALVNGIALVPFFRNGKYGMLDLMADDITSDSAFYINANTSGSFTYSLE